MSRHTDEEIERTRAAVIEAREQALQAKADAVRIKARNKADNIRRKAETKAKLAIAKGEARAARLEGIAPAEVERKIRLDVHGRPKPAMRGWIHLVAAPLSLAAGIVLICLAQGAALKWACAVFMVCSLVLFANSAAYHLGDWSPRVTDVLRRIDHLNIFLLIAGTYTPVSFALEPFWRNAIIGGMWACTSVAMIVHVIWIGAPRWLYTMHLHRLRCLRRGVHVAVLGLPLCRPAGGDPAGRGRRLLYRRRHRRTRCASPTPWPPRVRIP